MKQALLFSFRIFLLFILLIPFHGCMISRDPVSHKWVQPKRVMGDGVIEKRILPSVDFKGFDIEIMDIELWQDTFNSVTMIGDSNIIAEYYCKVENGILTIHGNDLTMLMPTQNPKLQIHMKDIQSIRISGNNLVGETPVKTKKLRLTQLSIDAKLDVYCDTLFCDLARHDCRPPNLSLTGTSKYTWVALRDGAVFSAFDFKGHCMDIMRDPQSIYIVNPKNFDAMHFGPKPDEYNTD